MKGIALWRLGVRNLFRVVWYRLRLRLGIHPVQRVQRELNETRFFYRARGLPPSPPPPSFWRDEALYFGWYQEPLGGAPPDWYQNPFTKQRVKSSDEPWWRLSDFASGAGDIKTVWEASRFDWVLAFAQHARCGDTEALERLNSWLTDWVRSNPPYLGPNWKCGQEASIRVLHLLLAARFLGQLENPLPGLVHLVEAHLARIYPTLSYAIAQDNNHGTSEAAALFMGGDWCTRQVEKHDRCLKMEDLKPLDLASGARALTEIQAPSWKQAGCRWLEERVARLVEPDGGFSQYSVNYHRLMLDTLCLTELWRQWFQLPAFSLRFYKRARAATRWLFAMTDPETGDVPNLGANDGANLLPLTDADYRDYRPAVHLATAVFTGEHAYSCFGPHENHLAWLGIKVPLKSRPSRDSSLMDSYDGDCYRDILSPADFGESFHAVGYIMCSNGPWKILFRLPHYRFRPRQSDPLHIDLWYKSENLLRDAGSYSYNAASDWLTYFSGPAGHNTVHFDGRDSMPNVGRFLKGAWLRCNQVYGAVLEEGVWTAGAAYRDWEGAEHRRQLHLAVNGLKVVDHVSSFRRRAILRWRLLPADWVLTPDGASCDRFHVIICTDIKIWRMALIEGWESRYYMRKTVVPVLEMEIEEPGTVITFFGEGKP